MGIRIAGICLRGRLKAANDGTPPCPRSPINSPVNPSNLDARTRPARREPGSARQSAVTRRPFLRPACGFHPMQGRKNHFRSGFLHTTVAAGHPEHARTAAVTASTSGSSCPFCTHCRDPHRRTPMHSPAGSRMDFQPLRTTASSVPGATSPRAATFRTRKGEAAAARPCQHGWRTAIPSRRLP